MHEYHICYSLILNSTNYCSLRSTIRFGNRALINYILTNYTFFLQFIPCKSYFYIAVDSLPQVNMFIKKGKSLLWPGASQCRIYYHRMWGQLSTTRSNVLKQPNGELLVAVNHNQFRTMASETVDPIDWSHPPPSWAVPPKSHVHSLNQSNLSGTRTCNRSMRGNHLAYAATQGIN